ncbi:hypothetical protein CPZ29_20165 [Klebsiella oxytoca]|nr:hypothetical protein CPZ29_20165 [Klebsiella oxytoca]PHH16296.1 hypothetical protein CRX54_23525 [Klebsiella oxytoca]
MTFSCWSNAIMVTLTKSETHFVLLRFMMLITKVNVNITGMRSRSNIHRLRPRQRYDRISHDPFTSVT